MRFACFCLGFWGVKTRAHQYSTRLRTQQKHTAASRHAPEPRMISSTWARLAALGAVKDERRCEPPLVFAFV